MKAILNAITTHLTAQSIPSLQKRSTTVLMVMKPKRVVEEMMRLLAMPMRMKMSEGWEE